jgi:cell division protein FtsW
MASQSRSGKQGESNFSGLSNFFRSPVKSSIFWFDRYFLHQSKLFYRLVMLVLLLVGFGLITVLSSSNVVDIKQSGNPFSGVESQLTFAIIGLALMVFFSTRSVEWLESISKLAFYGGIGGQLLVMVPGVGVSVGGNTNWIRVFGQTVQPSEFLKIGLILHLAHLLGKHRDELWDFNTGPKQVLIAGFGAAGLVFLTSRDMGTALVFLIIVLGMAYLAGMPSTHFNKFLILTFGGVLVGALSSPSRVARIIAFFQQGQSTVDGADWQVKHGLWALANGGLFGVGPGNSTLNWGWIPEVENDFIFANIAEEWGMLGALLVLFCFLLLGKYLRKIASNSNIAFASLAATGVMLWILLQALINIAVVLHLLPVLGVPLPLISKGGSSIVAVLMALGVVLAFERIQAPAVSTARRR